MNTNCNNSLRALMLTVFTAAWVPASAGEEPDAPRPTNSVALRERYLQLREGFNPSDQSTNVTIEPRKPRTSPNYPVNVGSVIRVYSKLTAATFDAETGTLRSLNVGRGEDPEVTMRRVEALERAFRNGTARPKHSASEAEAIARKLLQRLNVDMSRKVRAEPRFSERGGTWNIQWGREVEGYPFWDESVSLTINDDTGTLRWFSNHVTDYPCKVVKRLTRAEALENAKRATASWLERTDPEWSPSVYLLQEEPIGAKGEFDLMIVYPTRFFSADAVREEGRLPEVKSGVLVHAFRLVCRSTATPAVKTYGPPVFVYVDAETGEVVGGG